MKEWTIEEEALRAENVLGEDENTRSQSRSKIEVKGTLKIAIKHALRILERQDRTEKQLRDKLMKTERYTQEEVDAVLVYVKSYGYIDDFRYAKDFIRFRCHSKSKQQLLFALLGKGVDKEVIQEAIKEEYDEEEFCLICKFLEKKKYYTMEEPRDIREKLIAGLLRRGFRLEEILKAMEV